MSDSTLAKDVEKLLATLTSDEALSEEAKQKWREWQEEESQIRANVEEWIAEKDRAEEAERNRMRKESFEKAKSSIDLIGYKGPHGSFDLPAEDREKALLALQAAEKATEEGERINLQNAFIRLINNLVVKFGWNPPTPPLTP